MISIRQLQYLIALAETRHFARAAELCAVTQPALSLQIKDLEQALGFDLIERKRGATGFTSEGEEVLHRARRIITDVRDIEDFAKGRRGRLVGPLTMGVIPSIAPYLLPLCLPHIQRRYPTLELKLRETRTAPLLAELAAGQIDVAILALPVDLPGIDILPLFDDRFLVAVAAKDAASVPDRLGPGHIRAEHLLLLEEGHCLREQALSYCRFVSERNLGTLGATSLNTIVEMVAAGYGITLLPELAARATGTDKRIALKRFASPEPKRTVAMAWRKTSPRNADFKALAKLIRNETPRKAA